MELAGIVYVGLKGAFWSARYGTVRARLFTSNKL
jgi:hypothetical protein